MSGKLLFSKKEKEKKKKKLTNKTHHTESVSPTSKTHPNLSHIGNKIK